MSAFLYMRVVILLALSRVGNSKRLSFEFHKKILIDDATKIPRSVIYFLHQSSNASKGNDVWLSVRFTIINLSMYRNHTNWKALRYVKSLFEQCNASKSAYLMTKLMQNRVIGYTHIFIRNLVTPQALKILFSSIKITKRTRKFKKVFRKI